MSVLDGPGAAPQGAPDLSFTGYQTGPGGAVTVLEVAGSIDDDSYPAFEARLRSLFGTPARFVVLDFRGVDYANSMSVGFLIGQHKALVREGGSLAVAGLTRPVESLLRVMGLERLLRIFPTVDAAVTALAESAGIAARSGG